MKRRVDSEMEIDLINGMLWQRMSMHDPPASRTKKFARVEEDDFDDDSTAEHATAMVPEVEEDDEDVDNPSVWLIVRLASGIKVKGEFPVSTPFQDIICHIRSCDPASPLLRGSKWRLRYAAECAGPSIDLSDRRTLRQLGIVHNTVLFVSEVIE